MIGFDFLIKNKQICHIKFRRINNILSILDLNSFEFRNFWLCFWKLKSCKNVSINVIDKFYSYEVTGTKPISAIGSLVDIEKPGPKMNFTGSTWVIDCPSGLVGWYIPCPSKYSYSIFLSFRYSNLAILLLFYVLTLYPQCKYHDNFAIFW